MVANRVQKLTGFVGAATRSLENIKAGKGPLVVNGIELDQVGAGFLPSPHGRDDYPTHTAVTTARTARPHRPAPPTGKAPGLLVGSRPRRRGGAARAHAVGARNQVSPVRPEHAGGRHVEPSGQDLSIRRPAGPGVPARACHRCCGQVGAPACRFDHVLKQGPLGNQRRKASPSARGAVVVGT